MHGAIERAADAPKSAIADLRGALTLLIEEAGAPPGLMLLIGKAGAPPEPAQTLDVA